MRIALGNDHRGYELKVRLGALFEQWGHEVIDCGSDDGESVDYPDYAAKVARLVSEGKADRGILACGTGVGVAIAANKIEGIRAAPCSDEVTAEMCRRHNDVNVLCLSGDMLGESAMQRIVEIWLKTEFEGGRHARRLDKIAELERQRCEKQVD